MPAKTSSADARVLQDLIKTQPWRAPAWGGQVDKEGHVTIAPFLMGFRDVPLWIWEMPQEGVAYTLAVDPSFSPDGVAAMQVLRGFGQAAELRLPSGDLSTQERVAYRLGALYNWASIVVEMNGPGDNIFRWLKGEGYKNLWSERASQPGWMTTTWSRHVMSGQFLSLSVSGQTALRSGRLLEEMQAAAAGNDQAPHDLMDAYAIGCAAQAMPAARG